MRFKKILLVSIFLLAILAIGAVSASDDVTLDDNLTVEQPEVSLDASADNNNDKISSSDEEVLMENEITEDNLHPWVSSHEYVDADWDPYIVNVHGDDIVDKGVINLTISDEDSVIFSGEKSFDGEADENNDVIWSLNELRDCNIFNEVGIYTISLKYVNDVDVFDFGDYTFILTQINFNMMGGEVYYEYPFEIIKVYSENADVEVYVNGSKCMNGDENQLSWTLFDLGITSLGDYNITIVSYDDGEVMDNFTSTLNIVDNMDWFRAYSSFEVQNSDLTSPVVYLYSPDTQLDANLKIFVNDEFLDDFVVSSNWMSWNLTYLRIYENENYNVKFENDDGYLCDAWVNVQGIINEKCFNSGVSSHEPVSADWDPEIVNVHADDNVGEGGINITISKDGEVIFSYVKNVDEANDNNDICWSLDELRENDILNDAGTYTIALKYVNGDVEFDLGEYDFTLTNYNYNTMENELYNECPFEVIRVYDEVNVEVYVNGEICTVEDENPLSWTLSDLNITSLGDYNITIVAYDDGEVMDNFTFTLNVVDSMGWFRVYAPFEIETDDLENPVLYLYSPDNQIGETISMFKGEDFFKDVTVESNWMSWNLTDLGIEENDEYEITFENDDGYLCDVRLNVEGFKQLEIETWDFEERNLYTDTLSPVISIRPAGLSGMLDIIVNNTVKFHTIITTEYHDMDDGFDCYDWDLKSLGITEAGDYNVTLKFVCDGELSVKEYEFHVVDFDNKTFRAKVLAYDEPFYLYFFTPHGETGTVVLNFKGWDDDLEEEFDVGNETFELNESYWNKWVMVSDFMNFDCSNVEIEVNGRKLDDVDIAYSNGGGNSFEVNGEEIRSADDIVVWVYANTTDNNYTINFTCGNNVFILNISDLGDFEWLNGDYKYFITYETLSSFISTLNDKDKVLIYYDVGWSLRAGWMPFSSYAIQKEDDFIRFYGYEDLRVDPIKIHLAHDEDEEESDEDEPDEEDPSSENSQEDNLTVLIIVPDSLNIHETALVNISWGDYEIIKNLSDLYSVYDYECLGVDYYLSWDDFNLTAFHDKDIVHISVMANGELIGSRNFIMYFDEEEGWAIDYIAHESVYVEFFYGTIGSLEFGQGEPSRAIISVFIPEFLNITDGAVIITDENGTVIFKKLLSEFEDHNPALQADYSISDNITEFDYSIFKEGVPFTVSFTYDNITLDFAKGIRQGNQLLRINTPENIANFFKVTVSQGILINGSENAIIIEATDDANRQSVAIDMGGGYFVVYVNGKKVEDLGRLVRFDDETELELFRLSSGRDGFPKLIIYLSDLNITENGVYNIRVTHQPETTDTNSNFETELYNENITLTSNVKVDNATSEVYTGFGMDPILLYLDTYYGTIDDVSGRIAVLNSAGNRIFASDIKDLSSKDGRYYLKYSDFEDKDFGDEITVMYSDGNERNGNTTLRVTWKDINATEFKPNVTDNVSDYYGDFINLNIPELLNAGQIIVTVKFKNNHGSTISNMSVNTDFDSKAVYRFNIAEIKANYGNNFALALSDLGFYEDNGNYDIDVKFTADNVEILNVTNSTLNVEFLTDILITINETSRYAHAQPFATIKIFEPVNAYGEIYIDGKFYDKKSFEKGLITFTSSKAWTVGTHSAEVKVINSEFGSVLNSSTVTFKTVAQTEDVTVNAASEFKANEYVIINITVPKAGNVTVKVDKEDNIIKELTEGPNQIDLGVLEYGNHKIWMEYEAVLDDGNITFYNNYLTVFVNDDGRWLIFPNPLVLNDDDTIKINFGSGATGNVLIYIDEELVKNITLDSEGCGEYLINESLFEDNTLPAISAKTKYGVHTYKIVYSGDETHENLTQEGEFIVAYLFKDDLASEYPFKESYDITVTLPFDATGEVTLTVNNNPQTLAVKDGKATFKVDNLPLGEHDVLIQYSGNDYPQHSYHTTLYVSHYGVVGEYSDDAKYVSLMLPGNATGNLTVYNEDMNEVVYSMPLVEGKARIDLSKLSVGIYDIRAYYEGADYDVKEFKTYFKVLPDVVITQNATVGEDVNIFVDLDDSVGSILIIIDDIIPVLKEIQEGKLNHTLSTNNYVHGNHNVTFMYIGNSFNGEVFSVYDETKHKDVPLVYNMNLLPEKTIVTGQTNGNIHSEVVRKENGEIASDARGTISLFVNGVLTEVQNVVNGIASFDMSKYKNGKYNFEFVYSGDNKYDSSSRRMEYVINNRIAAKDMSVVYLSGGKYSVTVYNTDGKLAGNVQVSFLINNRVYRTVNTDSNGVARVAISSAPGIYKITANALGTSVTKKLTVKHVLTLKTVKVKKSAKKLVIKATLKKVKGKYLKGKKITFKFNGKKFTAKTNKKGVAKVTIKQNILKKLKVGKKVKYQATYLKDTVKKSVKVK